MWLFIFNFVYAANLPQDNTLDSKSSGKLDACILPAPAVHVGNSSVMDVTFRHKIINKISQKSDSSYMIKNVDACYHNTHWAEGKGQINDLENIVKPEKMWQRTWILDVM